MSNSTELSFPLKLYTIMVEEPKVLKWNVGHDSFRIIDEDELVNRILQKHFRTSRFSSFTRNLNIYGFKKIAKGEFAGSYCHPDFKSGPGGYAAVSRMRRCVRKAADGEPVVKHENGGTSTHRQTRAKPRMAPPAVLKIEPPTQPALPMERQHARPESSLVAQCMDDSSNSRLSMGSCDGSNFWSESLCEDDFSMEHELALPARPDHLEDEGYPNFYAGVASACCSMPFGLLEGTDHFQTPLAEDDDLAEWKKVLCFTSNNCPAMETETAQQSQPVSNGANAYCVHVPAGPLGATLECRGDQVFLSKVADRRSPLAHIPVGAQLVNLDGKDTTQMAVGQVSQLDESTCHRNRMVIFALTQCFDTALLAMTPALPHAQRSCDWGPPKAKSMHDDDIDMDVDTCSDSSPHPESPSHSSNNSWLQCFVDAI